jgi:hypothetical protein
MRPVPTNFWEWMSRAAADDVTAIVVLSIFAIVGIVAILAVTVHRIHKNRLDDALKRELLDRGMSAEEIALVVGAAQPKRGPCRPTKP